MTSITNPAVPKGSLIAVTGVNGLIASHVADQLLAAGYNVRGTVRNPSKAAWLSDLLATKYGEVEFELYQVQDMTAEGAFDDAMKDVSAVIHIASVTAPDANPHNVIPPSIAGALNVLKSAVKQTSIKRFVLTSSSLAAAMPTPGVEFTVHENSYNEAAVEAAWEPEPYDPSRAFIVYMASKVQAEQAVWKWAEDNSPGLVINTVLPSANFGKSLSVEHQGHPSTTGWVQSVFSGDTEAVKYFPSQYCIDVEDTARLHVAAAIHPNVENKRLFGFAHPYTWNDVLHVLQKLYPGKKFAQDMPSLQSDLSKILPAADAEAVLRDMGRPGWTSLEESLKNNTADLTKLEDY